MALLQPQPAKPTLPPFSQQAAVLMSLTLWWEPGKQKEQIWMVQGNQYLSRNTQASCQLASNPNLAFLQHREGWHTQEWPRGILSQEAWLVLNQELKEANLHWFLCKYLMLRMSKQTHSYRKHPATSRIMEQTLRSEQLFQKYTLLHKMDRLWYHSKLAKIAKLSTGDYLAHSRKLPSNTQQLLHCHAEWFAARQELVP